MLDLVIWSFMLALVPLALLVLAFVCTLITRAGEWMDSRDSNSLFEIEPKRSLCSPNHDPWSSSVSRSR